MPKLFEWLAVALLALASPVHGQTSGETAAQLFERAVTLPGTELDRRVELCERALELDSRSAEPGLEIGLHICAGEGLLELERFEDSRAHFEVAAALAAESGDENGLMLALYNTAFACTNLGDFERTLEAARDVAVLAQKLDRPRIRLQAQNLIGVAYDRLGDRENAIRAYTEALETVAGSGDWRVSYTLINNLSVLNMNAGRLDEALEYFRQGLELAEGANDRIALASTLANIGDVYCLQERFDEALVEHELALKLRVELGREGDIALSHSSLGEVLIELGEFSAAIEHLEQALEIQERLGQKPEVVATLNRLARAYTALDRDAEALGAASESSRLAEAIQAKTWHVKSLRELAKAQETIGEIALALEAERKAAELENELNSLQAARAFAEQSQAAEVRWREIQKNAEIASLEAASRVAAAELEHGAHMRTFLVAASVLVLGLAIVGWSAYLFRSRANQALAREHAIEKRLLEAQKLESLGLLSGGVAHDLNNILTVISGNSELARRAATGDERVLGHLAVIESACHRATEVSRQMLYYTGKNELEREEVDLGALVVGTVELLRKTAPARVSLEVEVEPRLPVLLGDRTQLGRVVLNLVTNAIESIGPEAGKVVARVSRFDSTSERDVSWQVANGSHVKLEIEDDGRGIEEARISRLFDPFFTDKAEGLGLGLATVQGIVRSHGGEVQVSSQVGEGSVFSLLLPAADPPLRTELLTPVPRRDLTSARSGRVLVVDDEKEVLMTTGQMLKSLGWESELVEDAKVALARVADSPDLSVVILDLVMPGTDIRVTLKALKRVRPELPILLVSGFDRLGLIDELTKNEGVQFLAKPFGIHELGRNLEELLDAQRATPESERKSPA